MGRKQLVSTVKTYPTIAMYMALSMGMLIFAFIISTSSEVLIVSLVGMMIMFSLFEIAYELNKRPVMKK
jgi:hypothetical protein